jgi:hypothetical protein
MVRPRTLRDEVRRARGFGGDARFAVGPPTGLDLDRLTARCPRTSLGPDWVLDAVPRELLVLVAEKLAAADLARLDAVCHGFHSAGPGETGSIVEEALLLRAAAVGRPVPPRRRCDAASQTGKLLEREVLVELERTLVTNSGGCELRLCARSPTGYEGVVHEPSRAPFSYRAFGDVERTLCLGSFATAPAAALAVAQYRWVEDNPCL